MANKLCRPVSDEQLLNYCHDHMHHWSHPDVKWIAWGLIAVAVAAIVYFGVKYAPVLWTDASAGFKAGLNKVETKVESIVPNQHVSS